MTTKARRMPRQTRQWAVPDELLEVFEVIGPCQQSTSRQEIGRDAFSPQTYLNG